MYTLLGGMKCYVCRCIVCGVCLVKFFCNQVVVLCNNLLPSVLQARITDMTSRGQDDKQVII